MLHPCVPCWSYSLSTHVKTSPVLSKPAPFSAQQNRLPRACTCCMHCPLDLIQCAMWCSLLFGIFLYIVRDSYNYVTRQPPQQLLTQLQFAIPVAIPCYINVSHVSIGVCVCREALICFDDVCLCVCPIEHVTEQVNPLFCCFELV